MSRNARILTGILVVVVVAAATWFAMRMFMAPPDDLDLARSRATANGLYQLAIEPELEPITVGPLHSWIVTVTTADGQPVTDADISIGGGMPQHGHGLPTQPQSAGHIGDGRYRIEGVRFSMTGWWVLTIGVSSAAGKDEADFNIVL
jgi:hypothetical protein